MELLLLLREPDAYEQWESLPETTRQQYFDDLQEFGAAVANHGRIIAWAGLDNPKTTKIVGRGAQRAVTDGPYAEVVEQIGGFYLIDVPDIDTATRLAMLLPDIVSVEIRPTAS